MNKQSKIYVVGYKGLVGSAIRRTLESKGYKNLVFSDFNLQRQKKVENFIEREQPEYIFLAAAKVGGIWANKTYPAEFIYSNLSIQTNVIHTAHKYGVKKLLFLGSSCIYPKFAPQPLKEEYLLSSHLEPTNEAYAIAKIAGLKMCRYYNQQYHTNFLSVMPTNLYGPGDNYNLKNSHVIPALIRKLHLGQCLVKGNLRLIRKDLEKNPIDGLDSSAAEGQILEKLRLHGIEKIKSNSRSKSVQTTEVLIKLWGTGSPRREFLYVDDLADAVLFLMEKCDYQDIGEIINIGIGIDISIKELALLIKDVVGYEGGIYWDKTKPDGHPRKLLDISRLNGLGWQARYFLKDGLKKAYQYYKKDTLDRE